MTWNTQLSSSSSSSNTEFEFGKSGRDLEHPVKWWWWWWWCRVWVWKKCVLSENRPTTQIWPDGSVQLGEKLGYFHRSHTKMNGFWRDTGSSENMGKLKWNKRLLEAPYRKCLWCTSFLMCGRLPLGDMQSCTDTSGHTLCYVQRLNVAAHCIFWVHKTSALFSHLSKLICLKKS